MKFEIDGLDDFISSLDRAANGGLAKEFKAWLEAMGMEFLDVVQDEIIRTQTVDTRRLLNSFQKGDSDNFWSASSGGLTLDIGTNVEYATFVNDGHFTISPSSGKDSRWVPGRWSGSRFIYEPNAKTGMLLKFQWVDGTNYWDVALAMFEKMFDKGLDRLFQEWIDAEF